MDFSSYSAKDFVLNESFQKWILDPDEETTAFWEDWIVKHPHRSENIEEARTIIRNIRSVIEKHVACDRDEVWDLLMKDIT
jgi:transmembrane sensor